VNKITADHLARRACVYIRQSTPDQVRHNLESQRRQYSLGDRARTLGWKDIEVIDEDLGISGSGIRRPGFERLLAAVCEEQVGAIFSIEASRLARTNREWHTLLEFCSIVGVLLIDAEAVYDPRLTNDRLLLGMKGTISEMEECRFAATRQIRSRRQFLVVDTPGCEGLQRDPKWKRPDENRRAAFSAASHEATRSFTSLNIVKIEWVWLLYDDA